MSYSLTRKPGESARYVYGPSGEYFDVLHAHRGQLIHDLPDGVFVYRGESTVFIKCFEVEDRVEELDGFVVDLEVIHHPDIGRAELCHVRVVQGVTWTFPATEGEEGVEVPIHRGSDLARSIQGWLNESLLEADHIASDLYSAYLIALGA
jgi:hypothetical protein